MGAVELIGTVDSAHPLVVVALEQEARHFVTDFPVLVTGVGKVRAALAGNICRCSNYNRIVEAVVAAGAGSRTRSTSGGAQ